MEIRMTFLTQFGGGSIKSIQRGYNNAGAANVNMVITISPVDVTKTELRLLGQTAADNSLTTLQMGLHGHIRLDTGTIIYASRYYAGNGNWELSWELTEYY